MIVGAALAVLACAALDARTSNAAQPPKPASATATGCILKAKPDTLWSLTQCCVADLKSNPDCKSYNAANDYVIIKDDGSKKPAAYLIVPTTKVTGVEDPKIFTVPYIDFWQYGWEAARTYLKEPAAATGLAINSVHGRGQNQLHIHISCILDSVAQTLAADDRKFGSDPAKAVVVTLGPRRDSYEVVKVTGLVGASSPFNLVRAIPGAQRHMADQSIAVVGARAPGWYYVLDTFSHGSNSGHAEQILDETCGKKV
jgi:CDP-diacylglycerol pyrophosphatase